MIKKMAVDSLCQSISGIVCLLHFQRDPRREKRIFQCKVLKVTDCENDAGHIKSKHV